MSLRVVSYGGGVQSTALLVLAARRVIDFPIFLMANVGDDSEHPATLAYVRDVAMPYAAAHGIEMHMLARIDRAGNNRSLLADITRPGSKSMKIPVRMASGKPGSRACTVDYKLSVLAKWHKAHGASGGASCPDHSAPAPCPRHQSPSKAKRCRLHPAEDCPACTQPNRATVAVGISLDEITRANLDKAQPHERLTYPLIGIGEETGLRMNRSDCARVIREAGLAVPPKSSCFFCPWHRMTTWQDMARDEPELFEKSCDLEDFMRERSEKAGRGPVWLTDYATPLRRLIDTNQGLLPVDDEIGECDSGSCFL